MDLIITVCDNAAGEVAPPVGTATAHWGYADPSAGDGSDDAKAEAFKNTLHAIHRNDWSCWSTCRKISWMPWCSSARCQGVGQQHAANRLHSPKRLLAEFTGTAALLCAVIGSGIMAQRISGGNDGVALLANTLATVFALYVADREPRPRQWRALQPAGHLGDVVKKGG